MPAGAVVEKTITAENSWTSPTRLKRGGFNLSVQGTISGSVVTLQRSFTGRSGPWHGVKSYTAPAEEVVDNVEENVYWRLGVATGNFGAGDSPKVRLGQG